MPNDKPEQINVTLTTDETALLDQLFRGLLMRKNPEVLLKKQAFASLYRKITELRQRIGR